MSGILEGMRVVEGSAFVAAPLGGMTLAQLGADVIRFDPIGGGLDRGRWPITREGRSLFWAGLNKGKRSIQVDLTSPAGRELISELIGAPGPDAGLFLTNFPARGWLAYDALAARRPDLIMVNITGNADGSSAVDYTINPATGFPWATGPRNLGVPFNHLLPAWDAITGALATTSLLAAERHRARTRAGQYVRVALSDVAFWMVGNLGKIAEVEINRHERVKDGNYLYGAFGRDFRTRDGRRIMIVALTGRQWRQPGGGHRPRRGVRQHREDDGRRPQRRGRALRRPRADRSDAQAVGAVPLDGRGARDIRRPRCLLGPLPDVHRARRAGPALLARRTRCSPTSSSRGSAPTECPARRWSSGRPSASRPSARRRWASTPRRCWPMCWASPTPKSGGCSAMASWPAQPRSRTSRSWRERRCRATALSVQRTRR